MTGIVAKSNVALLKTPSRQALGGRAAQAASQPITHANRQRGCLDVALLSVATALPKHKISQEEATKRARRLFPHLASRDGLYANTGVETRYACEPAWRGCLYRASTCSKPTVTWAKLDPPACAVRILGQCLLSKGREEEAEVAKAKAAQPEGATGKTDAANSKADGGEDTLSADEQPRAAQPEGAAGKTDTANAKADGGEQPRSADEQPRDKATDQTDDLLSPKEDELRAIKAAEKAAQPEGPAGDAPADSDTTAAEPQTGAAPVISIESDVDPESWAEYGGWYRQDYAILYRPTGHKDKFIYSWLFLTGPQAPKGDASPRPRSSIFSLARTLRGHARNATALTMSPAKGVSSISPRFQSRANREASRISFMSRISRRSV